ncbi:uncharacterized protein [Porites lutea]|uniref:uncharacterized protein n=1 Tax=Porites lutea TaxID=51062 RepID=UPI003CC5523C
MTHLICYLVRLGPRPQHLDECQSPDACGDNHVCNNTVGSYRCECLNGFVVDSGAQDPLNPVCVDFDECQIPNACGVNYVCNNTIGSYRCECSTGFVAKCSTQNLLTPVCVDLDECQSLDACGANDVCNNTIGSYRCECANGFVADSGAQDPLNPVCIDLDECQSPDACGANGVCNNTIGSYRCECANGFVADSGAQDPLNPVCIDLDECQSPDACQASHVCNNTAGSYRCECLTGFATDSGVQDPLDPVCIDVNECLTPDVCPANFICFNTVGSYRCVCTAGPVSDCGPENPLNPVCEEWCENNAVGLANGLIRDNQLTASSEAAQAKNGRLNFIAGSSWCASTNDSNPYLEIDLEAVHIICAVSTQGNAQGSQWVETYFLQSSTDGMTWTDYEEDGQIKVFLGNFDNGTTSKRLLFSVMAAKYLRFVAHSFHGRACMRVELYGARQFIGVGAALQRVSAKPAKTNPASGVKRFHPFHSMHYDEEEAEAAPTMWMDLLEGRVEPEPPNRKSIGEQAQGQSKSRGGFVGGGVEADGQQLMWQADRSLGKVDDHEVHNKRERLEEGAALGVVSRFGGDCRHVQNRVEVDKPFQVGIKSLPDGQAPGPAVLL